MEIIAINIKNNYKYNNKKNVFAQSFQTFKALSTSHLVLLTTSLNSKPVLLHPYCRQTR